MKNLVLTIKLLFLIMALSIVSCSSSKDTTATGVWVNKEKMEGKSYKAIYFIVETKDIQARQRVESDLANEAISKGYKAVKSIDVIPPTLSDPQLPSKEAIIESVKSSGCDAVFAVSLLSKEESVRYTPGVTSYTPMPYYAWTGTFGGYYDYWYPTVNSPGYYTQDKEYFIQSNLYDAASGELMLSVQSKLYNPESLNDFSKVYVSNLVKKLQQSGFGKK
jgi:hypothetical protein